MTKQEFINEIAKYVKIYAPKYDIKVYSPIIAQACLESTYGTSELALKANNFFGLKYHASVSEKPAYYKVGTEQNASGDYAASYMAWCSFSSIEKCVEGYFKFLFDRSGITRYNNLKNVTDPKKYLQLIKEDGYATSLDYVNKVYNFITTNNLTSFDTKETVIAETAKYYRVQVGAYSIKANAEAMLKKIKASGFSAIIKQYGNLYKVQCGAYSNKANAQALLTQLKNKGYIAMIVYC